ncbi:MAG: hypothetical protein R3C03_11410 [Pirellulaceae bacterium]
MGRITYVEAEADRDRVSAIAEVVTAEIYSTVPRLYQENARVDFYETSKSLEWVVETMLPPEKRRQISTLILESLEEHREELWRELQPVLANVLHESQVILQDELKTAISKRRAEFERIAGSYQTEFIEKQLLPVVETEVWPIVREETGPLVEVVGEEIWSEASVWRLAWRYIYDVSPLPQRDLTRKEFERFVDDKAIPILRSHVPEFLKTQRRVIDRVADNEKLQAVFRSGLAQLSNDEEVRRLLGEVFQEVFVDNSRLREAWLNAWKGDEMQAVMVRANEKLGPTITQIGESLFGNPTTEITPEFSEVLRSRVLFKDDRWFLLRIDSTVSANSPANEFVVRPGTERVERPFHIPATPRK